MVAYTIMLKDRTVEIVESADAYQQEGQMTTFFSTGAGRQVVDCWSTRVASFRTSEILIVRRVERDANPTTAGGARDRLDDGLAGSGEATVSGAAGPVRLRSA